MIGNERNEKDSSLENLYIENFSNTEFLSEPDVYEYLQCLSNFLKEYTEWALIEENSDSFDDFGWLKMWHRHVKELSVELFNSFIHGNLLSVAAMTRSLMECYIFIKILKKEQSQELIDEWYLCNMIHEVKKYKKIEASLKEGIKSFCILKGISFEEKWEYYNSSQGKGDKAWLNNLKGIKGIGTRALCKYIGEEKIHEDYQEMSAFVHGQDIKTKRSPFVFYFYIYKTLYLMVQYIFKTIRLFQCDGEIENEMVNLEQKLYELGETYLK